MVEILQKYFNLFQQMIYLLERCLTLSLSLSLTNIIIVTKMPEVKCTWNTPKSAALSVD